MNSLNNHIPEPIRKKNPRDFDVVVSKIVVEKWRVKAMNKNHAEMEYWKGDKVSEESINFQVDYVEEIGGEIG